MTLPWINLPNSDYIKLVVDDICQRPEIWKESYYQCRHHYINNDFWETNWWSAWNKCIDILKETTKDRNWSFIWGPVRRTEWDAARSALVSLVVWPDSVDLLSSQNLKNVDILAALGNTPAILLCPAAIALSTRNGQPTLQD